MPLSKKHIPSFPFFLPSAFLPSAFCLLPFVLFSQTYTLTPALISAAGGSKTSGNMNISYSVGEPAVTTLTNSTSPNVKYLTQGFQQPEPLGSCFLTVLNSAISSTICAGQNVTLTAMMSGGTSPYSYQWMPGNATTSSITVNPLSTVTYTVIATDSVNPMCSDSTTITVNAYPAPAVTISGLTTICPGGTTSLLADAGNGTFAYSWSNGQTTSIATGLSGGNNYTVTVIDGNNCQATQTISIISPPALSVTITTAPVKCYGDSTGNAAATVSGGITPYTYSWSKGQTTSSVTGLKAGTYSMSVSDSMQCSNTLTYTITEPAPLSVTIQGGNDTLCGGLSFDTLIASAPGGINYSWAPPMGLSNPNISNPKASPSATTIYTVTVTDTNGCSGAASAKITVVKGFKIPQILVREDSAYCLGDSIWPIIAVPDSNGVIAWVYYKNNTPILSVGDTFYPPQGLPVGTYTIFCMQGTSERCLSFPSIAKITIKSLPTATITPSAAPICSGRDVTLIAKGDNSYSWSNGTTGSTTVVKPGGTTQPYTITLTITSNANSCSKDTVLSFSVVQTPTASISAIDAIVCKGENVTLMASGGGAYFWEPGETGASVVVMPTINTTYSVIVSSSSGNNSCRDTAYKTISVLPSPTITATANPSTLCSGGSTTLTAYGGLTYTWSNGLNTTTANTNPLITPPLNNAAIHTFTVMGTDVNGCRNKETVVVTVKPLPAVFITAAFDSTCSGNLNRLKAVPSGAYTYTWVPSGNFFPFNGKDSIMIIPTATTNYSVTVTNADGCSKTATKQINILDTNPPEPVISGDLSYCYGDTVRLNNSVSIYNTWWWWDINFQNITLNSSNSTTGNSFTMSPVNATVGTHTVIVAQGNWLILKKFICASAPVILPIEINPLPLVDAGNAVSICPYGATQLTASVTQGTGPYTYLWPQIENAESAKYNPNISPHSTTTFDVFVTDSKGCKDTDTVTVWIDSLNTNCPKIICDSIYNGITPNKDGFNDEWQITGIEFYPNNAVSIYNRWGQMVWRKEHYENKKGIAWDGSDVPSGTYFYIIEVNEESGLKFKCRGWIEVTR